MDQIGILVPTLNLNQLAFEVINTINSDILAGTDISYTIFYEELTSKCMDPLCAVMNISEIHSFDGTMVATTIDTCRSVLNTLGRNKKIFYVWDLEFIRNRNNYIDYLSIYRNNELELIAPSQDYSNAIEIFANRKPNRIMEKLNFRELV